MAITLLIAIAAIGVLILGAMLLVLAKVSRQAQGILAIMATLNERDWSRERREDAAENRDILRDSQKSDAWQADLIAKHSQPPWPDR